MGGMNYPPPSGNMMMPPQMPMGPPPMFELTEMQKSLKIFAKNLNLTEMQKSQFNDPDLQTN
eukprot:Awhi_evm1s3744